MSTPEDIRIFTRLLRTDTNPFWERMRTLLKEKGFDPQTLVLADSFQDDVEFEFGIVVTPSREVFQFGFEYRARDVTEGVFSEWNDVTEKYSHTPYREDIEEAFKMAGGG